MNDSYICAICKIEKLVNDFPKHKTRPRGHHPYCKDCHSDYYIKKYQENKSQDFEYTSKSNYRQKVVDLITKELKKYPERNNTWIAQSCGTAVSLVLKTRLHLEQNGIIPYCNLLLDIKGTYRKRKKRYSEKDVVGMKDVVYFVKCDKWVKIGFSSNFHIRLRQLILSNPFPLEVLYVISGDRGTEKEIHDKFKHLHHLGEWYTITKELLVYLEDFENLYKN